MGRSRPGSDRRDGVDRTAVSAPRARGAAHTRQGPEVPRIAVLVDTATGWGRRLVYGVMGYARKHGPWHIWIEPRGQHEHLRPPPGWAGDGIIARVSTAAMARELEAARVPVVNVSGICIKGTTDFARVTTDVQAAGKLAARHFLDRGFRHFAYCGLLRFSYVAEHARAYGDALGEAGFDCRVYPTSPAAKGWKAHQAHLGRWLRTLPKPLAVFTWSLRGLAVLDACRWAGLHVPEEVAVLAGDEDDLLCEAVMPPLSGIETPSEVIGHEAAAALDALMHGGPPPAEPFLLKPTRVVTRQSTDTLAVDDPDVAAAVRFIRQNAVKPHVDVPAVLRVVPISRRALERRFEQVLGRTPAEEIRRVRLERARQLLLETDLPIPSVSAASGFGSPEYLSFVFKSEFNETPHKYRSRSRAW